MKSKIVNFMNEAINHENETINKRLLAIMTSSASISEADMQFLDKLSIKVLNERVDLYPHLVGPNGLHFYYDKYYKDIRCANRHYSASPNVDWYTLFTLPDIAYRKKYNRDNQYNMGWTVDTKGNSVQKDRHRPVLVDVNDPLVERQYDRERFDDTELGLRDRQTIRHRIMKKTQQRTGLKIVIGPDGKRRAVRGATEAVNRDRLAENAEIWRILHMGRRNITSPLLAQMGVRVTNVGNDVMLRGPFGRALVGAWDRTNQKLKVYELVGQQLKKIDSRGADFSKFDYYTYLMTPTRRAPARKTYLPPERTGDLLEDQMAEVAWYKSLKQSADDTGGKTTLKILVSEPQWDADYYWHLKQVVVKEKDYDRFLQATYRAIQQLKNKPADATQIEVDLPDKTGKTTKQTCMGNGLWEISRLEQQAYQIEDSKRFKADTRKELNQRASAWVRHVANKSDFKKKDVKED